MNQVTFGNGAARGRRIPDSEDKLVSKAMPSKKTLAYGAGATAAVGALVSPPARRMKRKAEVGGALYRKSPEFRSMPLSERKQAVNDLVGKAMTSSAMASITPKGMGTTSSTPPSATPVKTKGLKPTGGTVQGAASGGVGKAYRSWDPESARVHRQSTAQGGLAAGGVALAASGASSPKRLTPHKGLERLSDPKLVLSQTYESGTPGRDGKMRAKSGVEGHAGGRQFTAAERKGLEGTRKMTGSAKGRIALGAAALGGAAGLRRFTNDKANRQYY